MPDNLTTSEQNFLGKFKHEGLTKIGDFDSYYCSACSNFYGVTCPICQASSTKSHLEDAIKMFNIVDPVYPTIWRDMLWVKAICRKCDSKFQVIYR